MNDVLLVVLKYLEHYDAYIGIIPYIYNTMMHDFGIKDRSKRSYTFKNDMADYAYKEFRATIGLETVC